VTETTEATERERAAIAAVDLARHPGRPRALQVIARIATDFTELRGDRLFGDDRAVVGGTARIGDRWVMLVGQEKGSDALSRALHNFGMPHPEGYRKAQRLMRLAERFSLPVVCLIDTPAAHAGVGAEERGQAWAISASLSLMLGLRVPIVSAVLALENAVYTVAPPETCAAILYRDAAQRARAAAAMRPGVDTAHEVGLVDELVPEPGPGAHAHPELVVAALKGALARHLDELSRLEPEELISGRAQRHRAAAG
jgi:acetyl-CoA carboxylase carboxyl transferase subunit alpha